MIVGILFLWMYVAMFPSFADKKEEFNKVLEVYPESLMKAFGISDAASIFNSIENFLAVENYSFLWPILAIALAVSIGGYSVAGEVEQKTIETLLSQPLSRSKLFWGKYFAGLAIILVFSIITIFSVVPLSKIHNVSYNLDANFKMLILGFLFVWTIFSISTLFSSAFSERSKPYFFAVGLLIVMYAINIVVSLKENLANLKYFSFFYYFDSAKALQENSIDAVSVVVLGGIALLSTVLALMIFNKRDLAVS
jgi:ABC-2 type transport system permease protein